MSRYSFLVVDGTQGIKGACDIVLEKIAAGHGFPSYNWIAGAAQLPAIAQRYAAGAQNEALKAFEQFKSAWFQVSEQILLQQHPEQMQQVRDLFTEVEWLLYDEPIHPAPYYIDQIVPIEPLVLSRLISMLLTEHSIAHQWRDARDFIRTDDTFGNAQIDIAHTGLMWAPLHKEGIPIILQAGIGASDENETTQWSVTETQLIKLMEH